MIKVLIIGSSYSIKNTFSKKYISDDVHFINFREIWNNRKIENFDIIIISGFHQEIVRNKFSDFERYVEDYTDFIKYLKNKSKKIFLISTFIPQKRSFCRVVFFYYKLVNKIIDHNDTFIISFKKIINNELKQSYFFKILKLFNVQFTEQDTLIEFTKKYYLTSIPQPKFFFLKIRRIMTMERILRIFDKN
tara:strand:- start:50 stop:622 length:573 start_codon:yes stop_codon:yes gene_type:complete